MRLVCDVMVSETSNGHCMVIDACSVVLLVMKTHLEV